MSRTCWLTFLIVAAVGCSGPGSKQSNDSGQPDTGFDFGECPLETCPDDTVLKNCDPASPRCEEHGDGDCTFTCERSRTDDACTNEAWWGVCDPGYDQVENCPTEEECVTAAGCESSRDVLCAPRRELSPDNFYRQCTEGFCSDFVPPCEFDEDCALIPSGDVCDLCVEECPGGAVRASDAERYRMEFATANEMWCDGAEPCAADCLTRVAHCDLQTNRCVARESKRVTTTGAPKNCDTVDDCAAVFAGEVCDACKCPNDAVRADFVDTYETAFDVECAHNVDCDCGEPQLACEAGECVVVQ